jgi:hypothetical protein
VTLEQLLAYAKNPETIGPNLTSFAEEQKNQMISDGVDFNEKVSGQKYTPEQQLVEAEKYRKNVDSALEMASSISGGIKNIAPKIEQAAASMASKVPYKVLSKEGQIKLESPSGRASGQHMDIESAAEYDPKLGSFLESKGVEAPFNIEDIRAGQDFKGYGNKILSKTEKKALLEGADSVYLNASPTDTRGLPREESLNKLTKFYEKNGYQVVNDEGVNKVMAKVFSPEEKTAALILREIDTPEKAAALTGKAKKNYLDALDVVFGPKQKRASDIGFGPDDYYHGTTFDKPIKSFNPRLKKSGQLFGEGTYLTKNAFDPRFKNSTNIMAGAGAIPLLSNQGANMPINDYLSKLGLGEQTEPLMSVAPTAPIEEIQAPEVIEETKVVDPNAKYQEVFNKIYEQQKMNNPGQPDSFLRQTALNVARSAKNLDELKQEEALKSNLAKSAKIDQENAQRAELGLPPLDNPMAAALVKPQAKQIDYGTEYPEMPEAPMQQAPQAPMPQAPSANKAFDTGFDDGSRIAGAYAGIRKVQDQEQQRAIEFQKKIQEAAAAAKANIEAADKEQALLQPKDFWADKSTGAKIGAVLALALGGLAGGMRGDGKNTAADILENVIRRDIELQKEKYTRAKDRGQLARSAYSEQLKILGDEDAAKAAVLNSSLKKQMTRLQEIEARTQNQAQKANIMKTYAEIGEAQMKTEALLMDRMAKYQLASTMQKGQEINPEMLDEKSRERFVSDKEFGGLATTKEGALKVNERVGEYRAAKDGVEQLLDINKMAAGKSVTPALRAKADQIATLLQGTLRSQVLGPGAITEGEREMLVKVIANPTNIFSLDSTNKVRLNALMQKLDKNMETFAKPFGIKPKIRADQNNSVMVQSPNGKTMRIPRTNLAEAQKRVKGLKVLDGQ